MAEAAAGPSADAVAGSVCSAGGAARSLTALPEAASGPPPDPAAASKRTRWEDSDEDAGSKKDKKKRKESDRTDASKERPAAAGHAEESAHPDAASAVPKHLAALQASVPSPLRAGTNADAHVRSIATMGCRSVEEFEKLNVIQEGTYGVVYRARDKRTGEVVALKKLKMEREKEGFPITSIREIRILMGVKHPNVVDLREVVVGHTPTNIYIVMEFLEHDLKDLTEQMRTPFIAQEIKCLMLQLLRGLAHLHRNWIVHRDLKTSNLLMNNRGMAPLSLSPSLHSATELERQGC